MSDDNQPESGSRDSEKLQILVVEDNGNVRNLIRVAVETPGRHITEARTAKEALAYLKDHSIDLMILDVGLPGDMSGLTLARVLKGQAQYRDLSIIIVSGHCDALTIEQAKTLGIDGFLYKPFKSTKLADLVGSVESRLSIKGRSHHLCPNNTGIPDWLYKSNKR